MAGAVLDFPKAARNVWTCGECGGRAFEFFSDGVSRCHFCGTESLSDGVWLKTRAGAAEVDASGGFESWLVPEGGEDFALRRLLQIATKDGYTFVAIGTPTGGIRMQGRIKSEDDRTAALSSVSMIESAIRKWGI